MGKDNKEDKDKKVIDFFPKNSHPSSGSGIWPMLIIFLGVVFLFNNFGILSWDIWDNIWRFWPIVLILLGLEAILGRNWVGRILVSLIGFATVVFILIFALGVSTPTLNRVFKTNFSDFIEKGQTMFESKEELTKRLMVAGDDITREVTKREVKFQIGAAKFELSDNVSNDFLRVDASYFKGVGEPVIDKELEDGVLKIEFETKGEGLLGRVRGESNYDAVLGQVDLISNISINLGAGKAIADFDQLALDNFSLDVGAGSGELVFQDEAIPQGNIRLEVGAGSIGVSLPEGVGIRVRYDIGAGVLIVDNSHLSGGGVFTSENYSESEVKVEIEVKIGAGAVEIIT